MASDHSATWATYQSAWRDISEDERNTLLVDSVAADGRYQDPQGETSGIEELAAYIATFRQSAPGSLFSNYRFLTHHDQAVANWTLNGPDGEVMIRGASHAVYGADGKLTQITGFFPG